MYLKDIAEIITGHNFRGAVEPDKEGPIRVLQARDLIEGTPVTSTDSLTRISVDSISKSAFLKKNDVLLVSRGSKGGSFRAAVFLSDEENIITSSSVHIIRVTDKGVLPEYLSHYLNSPAGQTSLVEISTGSYIASIPRRRLEEINAPVPEMTKQKAIIDLYRNMQAQQKILNRKNELKQQIIRATFNNIIKHHV